PIERINGRFSVITANIISGELVRLMPYLGKRLKRGGSLVLSGILKEETDEIKGSLAEAGLTCIKVSAAREKNDIWATMLIKKWR
ncbi:MAG: 50S ribosomal protein L11 methyltransferase, partial [Deltaproteobacteria bacterium]|nr:50S ribosomal protein L11 methyltransferase [Deltaproteobacteria bacterium]